ncbi:protoporphyrinogen oxidase [Nitrospina gracilis]|uniref:protoporphyrinogen oxidase n=1 Tax=Nitrospina gracilis TaxID=35801 RepID=UPI001F021F65|nr:protoporphyrinogen oxidase [Nitrospina gracilis]MCF8721293.1 oxygen-dependent protoporphyrinogen oxidase [Nitrospina gracilis Nb-211]
MKKLVIIGGGIAGLAAAYRIQEEFNNGQGDIDCTVLEGSDRLGGKICTIRENGFILERGPDSFITQKPWALELCKKIGLEDELMSTRPETPKTYVYLNKKMVTLPDGLTLMVPTKFLPFALSSLFSIPGKVRMAMDLFIPKKFSNRDESLAAFVRRRLGEEALQRMAQPLMCGIYSSDPETMSLHSTFPMFAQTEKKYRSLILGMLAAKRQRMKAAPAPQPKKGYTPFTFFVSLKNGLGSMIERIIEESPDITFRKEARVKALLRKDEGWQVELATGERLEADAVLVTTPANVTAKLFEPVAPRAAELLNRIPFVSTAAVTLAFKKETFKHPLNGFGFVVPYSEGRKISACTWVTSKFYGRAPEDYVLLRSYVGGALNEQYAEQSEEDIYKTVLEELQDIMGFKNEPEFYKVFQYKKGNVQYQVGHGQLIESVYNELKPFPGLYVAGSAYHGVGIPDCVLNGTRTVESALRALRGTEAEASAG